MSYLVTSCYINLSIGAHKACFLFLGAQLNYFSQLSFVFVEPSELFLPMQCEQKWCVFSELRWVTVGVFSTHSLFLLSIMTLKATCWRWWYYKIEEVWVSEWKVPSAAFWPHWTLTWISKNTFIELSHWYLELWIVFCTVFSLSWQIHPIIVLIILCCKLPLLFFCLLH